MKYTLLFLFIVASGISSTISGQCQFQINEFDKFDRVPRIETDFETIHHKLMAGRVQVGLGNIGFYEDYLLVRLFIQHFRWSITKQQKVSFLFDDDSIIHLFPDANVYSSNNYDSQIGQVSGTAEVGIIGLPLTEKDLNTFYEKELIQIRIQLKEGIRQYNIKKKNRERIKFLIQCTDKAIDDIADQLKAEGIKYDPKEVLAAQEQITTGYSQKTDNGDGTVTFTNPTISTSGKKSAPIGVPAKTEGNESHKPESSSASPKHQKSNIDFESMSDEDTPPPPQAPPPPPPEEEIEEIFKVVETMPRFPGCEDVLGSNKEKEDCAKQKMLEFIYQNLKYPQEARDSKVEGMCVVQFVINKKGIITQVKTVRNIGSGCGEAASNVVHMMNQLDDRWTPGHQRGENVNVLYTLPVRFKLEG